MFSLVSFDIDKDVQDMERQRAAKAGAGGGWTHPNMVSTGPAPGVYPMTQVTCHHWSLSSDVILMPAAPVDVHTTAQPYMPGPAVYHPPLANNI